MDGTENIKTKIIGNKLIIEIDLDHRGEVSSTGKSHRIASTCGNKEVTGGIMLGINAYIPTSKEERKAFKVAQKATEGKQATKKPAPKKQAPKKQAPKVEKKVEGSTIDFDLDVDLEDLQEVV